MTILYIYLGSIALTSAVTKLYIKTYEKELYNRGYREKDVQRNVYMDIRDNILTFLYMCIPIANLVCSAYLFFQLEKEVKESFEKALKSGNIEKIQKEDVPKFINTLNDNNIVKPIKVVVHKLEDKEMSREKKLDFLRKEYKILTEREVVDNSNEKKYKISKRR